MNTNSKQLALNIGRAAFDACGSYDDTVWLTERGLDTVSFRLRGLRQKHTYRVWATREQWVKILDDMATRADVNSGFDDNTPAERRACARAAARIRALLEQEG